MGLHPESVSLGKKVEPQWSRSLTGRQGNCRLTSATTPGQELGRYFSEEVEEPCPSLSLAKKDWILCAQSPFPKRAGKLSIDSSSVSCNHRRP